eukprot:s1169_g3.t1
MTMDWSAGARPFNSLCQTLKAFQPPRTLNDSESLLLRGGLGMGIYCRELSTASQWPKVDENSRWNPIKLISAVCFILFLVEGFMAVSIATLRFCVEISVTNLSVTQN